MARLADSLASRALRRLGETLRGRYRVDRLIGIGGMAAVYAGVHRNGHPVAIKILTEGLASDPEIERLFRREAQLANTIGHPGVVPVIDDDVTEDGFVFLVMPLLEGETLRARAERHEGRTLPAMEVVVIAHAILGALGAAHAKKIVHRDIKPENVFLTTAGDVRVLDFGIGRFFEANESASATRSGRAIGTPAFMAPEQALGRHREVDGRTDLWALGATMFTLLSGRFVHEGQSASEICALAATRPPRPLADVAPEVPEAVRAVVDRALTFEREGRWGSAEEMDGALGEATRAAFGKTGEELPRIRGEVGGVVEGGDSAPTRSPGVEPESLALSHDEKPHAPTEVLRGAPTRTTTGAVLASVRRFPRAPALALAPIALLVLSGAGYLALRARRGDEHPLERAARAIAADACTSSATCRESHGGDAWHCNTKRHTCVEVRSPDCTPYSEPGDLLRDDTLWVGGLFPLGEPQFLGEMLAVNLARQEFARALGASDARAGKLHARPIAFVGCSESEDAERAASHLADLEVPAVIGFRSAKAVRSVIPTIFLPNHILSFVSINQGPDTTRIPEPSDEPRLVWRSTLNTDSEFVALSALIESVVEARARARAGGGAAQPIRIARLKPIRYTANDTELFRTLRFNGRSALENGDNFRQFVFDDDADGGSPETVRELLDFEPQIVVFGGAASATAIIWPLERLWPSHARPFYLTPSGFSGLDLTPLKGNPERRHRFFSAINVSTTLTNAQLVLQYNRAHPHEPVSRTESPQPSYDAFYVVAYAIHALGESSVDGPAISRAIDRLLPPGRPIDVGESSIFDGFEALRGGANIDLNGAIGSLDFNRSTGEAPIDYAILCLGVDPHGDVAEIESGLVYDARARRLTGRLNCP